MKPFSDAVATETCTKCGWIAPTPESPQENQLTTGLIFNAERVPKFVARAQARGEEIDERGHLEWACPNCGHRIATATKDA